MNRQNNRYTRPCCMHSNSLQY